MADFTVVVALSLVVGVEMRGFERHRCKPRLVPSTPAGLPRCGPSLNWEFPEELRDHVLMLVVRKLDHELAIAQRVSKRKSRLIPGRDFGMTNRTNGRPGSFEKLRTMTTYTRIVIGIVRDIGIASRCPPVTGRNFVASIARLLMFFSSVKESGVID